MDNEQVALARNKSTGHIYEWKGGTTFTNISTEVTMEITMEQAKKNLVIPVGLNAICNDNPLVYKLIKTLQLGAEEVKVER